MIKNFLIGFLLVLVLIQIGYTASKTLSNPALMHMKRREFIAASIAQGLTANGHTNWQTPLDFADEVMQYTNAVMERIDKEDN